MATAVPGRAARRAPAEHLMWAAGVIGLGGLAWWIFVRPVTPLDLHVFVQAGQAVTHGRNPFPTLGTTDVWSGSAFVYPWLTAWLFAPASALSLPSAAVAMTAVSALAVALGVACLVGRRLRAFGCVLFAAPTLDGLQMGTLNAVLFLGLCVAWRWRDRPAVTGFTIGVLITLKVLCWPLVVWLLLTRRFAGSAWAAGSAAVLLGAGWLMGPLGPFSYASLLSQLGSHEVTATSGLQGMLVRWSLPAAAAEVIALALAAAIVTLAAKRGDAMIYAATVVAALLASPVVWHHYYLLAAAPLLLVRKGAWWYLVVGWASVPARPSSGLSWVFVTVLADVGIAAAAAVLLWRGRHLVLASLHRHRRWWLGGALAVAALVAGLTVAIGILAFLSAVGPSVFSVAACCGLLLVAYRRTARAQPASGP
jgi:alpha-1,2-mannosyltransferase